MRRTIALLLSPVGLLLISATRLLIISDYNTTTATTIAASGGYVNTLLGTVMPLVPIFLPYFALVLLLFGRFVLSALAFGAAVLISPTRLAPITALSTLQTDWAHAIKLFHQHMFGVLVILVIALAIDVALFFYAYGPGLTPLLLAVAATFLLAPYIYFVYPFPHAPIYYETYLREPWLPPEQLALKSGDEITGYVLSSDVDWTIVLVAKSRTIQYYSTDDVRSRLVCQLGRASRLYPLIRLVHAHHTHLPPCGAPTILAEPSAQSGRQTRQWTAKTAVTSSQRFHPLPGLSELHFCAANQALAELKVRLKGASAGFRIEVDRSGSMAPGAVRFIPKAKHSSFSLAFVRRLPGSPKGGPHTVSVEWRSPTGRIVELRHATLSLRYRASPARC